MSHATRILLRDATLWVAFLAVLRCCPAPTCPPLMVTPVSGGLVLCDYCGDEDAATPWTGHETGCPDSALSPKVLVDGNLLECEVR